MANKNMNGECLVQCKSCGTINTAVWGGFFKKQWNVKNCTKCNKRVDISNMETVICPHCGKLVEKTHQNLCLACGKLLYQDAKVFRVTCKNCGITNLIPFDHDGKVNCMVCGEPFDDKQLQPTVDPTAFQAQYIKLKDQQAMLREDLIIYKHPLNRFPAGSRIQVNQGTWGLVLQNGAYRQYPCSPDSYPLNTTDESQEQKLALAAEGKDVILDTEIYCVLKTLPEIKWGTPEPIQILIQNGEETRDYNITANGSVVLEINDAKAFVDRFGFMERKGKGDILKSDPEPGSEDGELIREVRNQISDALKTVAQNMIGLEELEPAKLSYKQAEIEKQMYVELDRIMIKTGLIVNLFRINNFHVQEKEADRHELIDRTVQRDFSWETRDVRLFPGSDKRVYADYTFSGSARLKIANEKTLYDLSEVRMADNALKLENFFVTKLNDAIVACAAPSAQSVLDEKHINIQDLYRHTKSLSEELKASVQSRLSIYGLALEALYLDQPSYRESDALKREGDMDERRKKLIRYAEEIINWDVKPFDIHMKNDKGLKASVHYSGNCTFKVTDQNKFFAQSEIDGYLHSDSFVEEKTVNDYYAMRINSHFSEKLCNITQKMIDVNDWDIRELAQYTEELKMPVMDTLNDLSGNWGLQVESVYLHETNIILSPVLQSLGNLEKEAVASRIKVEENDLENKTETKMMQSDLENAGIQDDLRTGAYIHHKENETRRGDVDEKEKDIDARRTVNDIHRDGMIADAVHQSKMKAADNQTETSVHTISGQILIDQELNRREILKKNYGYELERKEKEHEKILEQIKQQAQIDDLKFQETLNGIMHSIADSNLEWQKKLDEYARLSRQLGVQDIQDARKLAAETDADIMRIQGQAKADNVAIESNSQYDAGIKGVQLNTAQAQLQETINRYAEDREERIAAADYARQERAVALVFQQELERRREIAEEQMAALQEKQADVQREREFNLRMVEMGKEIEKLRLELDAEKHKVQETAGLGKVQSESEARAREAEYKYRAEKEAQNQAREDEIMNRAEALFRYVQNLQAGIESANRYMKMHADDNETSVRMAYAEVEKNRASGMNELQWSEIVRKLDELEKEIAGKKSSNAEVKFNKDEYDKLLRKVRKVLDEVGENRKILDQLSKGDKTILNSRICLNCGHMIPRGNLYCGHCGADIRQSVDNRQPGTW